MDDAITLPQLEQAINYWRDRLPAADSRLCAQAAALAAPYALMILAHRHEIMPHELGEQGRQAYEQWRTAHDTAPSPAAAVSPAAP